MSVDLKEAVRGIMRGGPDRVVINSEGDGIPPKRAWAQHGITPDVIFIRDDGWTLGAPAYLEDVAERLWRDQWVGVLRRPGTEAEPYERKTG